MPETTNSIQDSANDTDSPGPHVEIHLLEIGDDTTPFRTLNEEWITQYFTLEVKDREVSKMTITTRMRGLGLGRRLLGYAIAQAKAIGANSLFLGTDKSLKNAIHLYEEVGFQYIGGERIPRPVYARENVFMELRL